MKSFKNMFTLVLISLGLCTQQIQPEAALVPVVHAQHDAKHMHNEIYNFISQQVIVFNANHHDKKAVITLLKVLKEGLAKALHNTPANMYGDFKNAVQKLNPDNILMSIMHIKTILNNINPASKKLIMDALNQSPYAKYTKIIC